jgi:Concanavalin A-like lectin/glucanases superfamily
MRALPTCRVPSRRAQLASLALAVVACTDGTSPIAAPSARAGPEGGLLIVLADAAPIAPAPTPGAGTPVPSRLLPGPSRVPGFALQAAQACVGPPAGLAAWWPADGNAADVAGRNEGTLEGSATFAAGMVGQAFRFAEPGDFVAVPDAPAVNIGTGDFSLDAWVQTSFPDPEIIMDKRTGPIETPLGYHFYVGLVGIGFQMGNGEIWTNFDSGFFIQDGTFHHVAVTVRRQDPGGGKILVDGSVIFTFDPTPLAGNLDNTADFRIGASTLAIQFPGNTFQGLIDEMELFHRALTEAEVRAIFAAGRAGKCRGPGTPAVDHLAAVVLPAGNPTGLTGVWLRVRLRDPDDDPKAGAKLAWRIDWGDGVVNTPAVGIEGEFAFLRSRPYTTPGPHTITVTATDPGGLTSAPAATTVP